VTIPPCSLIGYNLEEDRKHFFVTPSGIVVIPKGTEISAQLSTGPQECHE
jgi:glucose-1-phosphate adenylyltransferase